MTPRADVWLVDGDPVAAAPELAPGRTVVPGPPAGTEAFDLGDLEAVWPVTVTGEDDCSAVLEAVMRGLSVVVRVDGLEPSTAARFTDELHRAAGRTGRTAGTVPASTAPALSDEQVALLRTLGEGKTLAAAAASLGLGVRTASRRLAEARRILGVETTAEAVVQVSGGA